MNLRPTTLLWMLLLACGFFGLYTVKYRVQAIKAEVAATERQLLEEKKNLHVLEAEWSYLNRPERLARLSDKYLVVGSLTGEQLKDYASLPISNPADVIQAAANAPLKKTPASSAGNVALASGAGHGR